MAISLAPAALQRIQGYLTDAPAALGLRFGVKRTGCSGWSYVVDMAREAKADDVVSEQDGVGSSVTERSLS